MDSIKTKSQKEVITKMNGETVEKSESAISRSEVDYINKRIDTQNRKIRLLVRILVDKKIIGVELAKSVEETFTGDNDLASYDLIDWLLEESFGIEEAKKFWIAGAIKRKGALRRQLGIKEDEKIPKSVLQQIINTETGKTITFRGKKIRVTTQLKRRALLAVKLGKMKK